MLVLKLDFLHLSHHLLIQKFNILLILLINQLFLNLWIHVMIWGSLLRLSIGWSLLCVWIDNWNSWGTILLVVLNSKSCISSSLQILLWITYCLKWLSKIHMVKWNIIIYNWLLIIKLFIWCRINNINHI